jgi:hypothetical protein
MSLCFPLISFSTRSAAFVILYTRCFAISAYQSPVGLAFLPLNPLRLEICNCNIHRFRKLEKRKLQEESVKKGRAVSGLPPQERLTKFRNMCLNSNVIDFAVVRRSSKIVFEEFEFDVIIGYIFYNAPVKFS